MAKIWQWVPAASMMLVSVISYIDRNTLALLAPTILGDTHLTAEQYGFIISAFSVAYMAGNPVWGRYLDRAGLRRGMTLAVSVWTVASTAHAWASGFLEFAVARSVLGFGEGATFPGGMRTAVETLPPEKRSRGVAVAYSGGSLGALITPLVVTPVALWWTWRGAFLFSGFVGAVWIVAWLLISRSPALSRAPQKTAEAAPHPSLRDGRLWGFMAIYALGGIPLAFVLYGASLYLANVLRKTQAEIGAVLWIPPLGWELGYFFWGWVMDRFAAHGQATAVMRRMFAALAILSFPLALASRISNFAGVLAILFFAMFVAGGYIIGAVAHTTSVYSSRNAAFLAGLGAGSWSALVAAVMPAFGWLFDHGHYNGAFLGASICPFIGFAAWRGLNSRMAVERMRTPRSTRDYVAE